MNVVLLNAVLGPLLLLVAVPVIIHLFARSRPPQYRFSSVVFILKILRSTMRIKRPQDWLLLVMRTLLFALAIFLFLRPLFFSQRRLAGRFERKNVVLIVDATASMAYVEGGQTRFAAACAEASEIIGGLSARDRANIVWLKREPEPVFPSLGKNVAYLRDALRRARVTSEAGDTDAAVQAAVLLFDGQAGKNEVCIISDFQRTGWDTSKLTMPDGIEVINVQVGSAEAANGAVMDIYCDPTEPLIGELATVYCDVSNYSSEPRRRKLFLNLPGSRQSRELMIPAWGRATALFRHKFKAAGPQVASVSLSEDGFSEDDERWKVIKVRESLTVGMFAADEQCAAAWKKVLDALGWATVRHITAADLTGELDHDVLMLSGWNGEGRDRLRARIEEGSVVVCNPAHDCAIADVVALAGPLSADPPAGRMRWESSSERLGVSVENVEDELFALFAEGEYGDPARGTFAGRLVFDRGALPSPRILLAYGDGVPALARVGGRSGFVLWNMTLDPDRTSWAGHVEFLPFVSELLLCSRRRTQVVGGQEFVPGSRATCSFEREVLPEDLVLRRSDGSTVPVVEFRREGAVGFSSEKLPETGLYTWEYRGSVWDRAVVNFAVVESDLRAMSEAELSREGTVTVRGGSAVRNLRDGLQLWPYLLAMVVATIVAEGLVLLWVERT